MSAPKNCHFISRFLTKPWEVGERQLAYYDFKKERIIRASSRSLFAGYRLNDAHTEQRLNELMETPMADNRLPIAAGRTEIDDSRVYRAIALLIMLQAPRTGAIEEPRRTDAWLSKLLSLPEAELDQVIQLWLEGHQLVAYGVGREDRLFFPSTGMLALPVVDKADPSGFGICGSNDSKVAHRLRVKDCRL
jgi:hypothetical protein